MYKPLFFIFLCLPLPVLTAQAPVTVKLDVTTQASATAALCSGMDHKTGPGGALTRGFSVFASKYNPGSATSSVWLQLKQGRYDYLMTATIASATYQGSCIPQAQGSIGQIRVTLTPLRDTTALVQLEYQGACTGGAKCGMNGRFHTWQPSGPGKQATQLKVNLLKGVPRTFLFSLDAASSCQTPSVACKTDASLQVHLHYPEPRLQVVGQGCQGKMGTIGAPRFGGPFQVSLTGGALSAPAFLALGHSNTSWGGLPLPLDLAPYGAPGCKLHTGFLVLFPASTGTAGQGAVKLTLPVELGLYFPGLYLQWLQAAPVNGLGLVVSDAARLDLKP